MEGNAALITTALAFATVVADVALVLFFAALFWGKSPRDFLPAFITDHILLLGALTASAAIALSLYYSEIVGFEPCVLCWWQRIFIYPLALIFFIASRRADYAIWRYTIPLSVVGLFFAVAHWIQQTFHFSLVPCAASGPDCSKIYFLEFGYVTFPVMAITVLASLIAISLTARSLEKK